MKDQVYGVGYRRLPEGRSARWAPWPIARTAPSTAASSADGGPYHTVQPARTRPSAATSSRAGPSAASIASPTRKTCAPSRSTRAPKR